MLNLESVEPGSAVYLDTTTELIRVADAVIVLLDGSGSLNTALEAGLAIGLERRVLLVADDDAVGKDGLPDRLLAGLPRVRAKATDTEALTFHLGAFLQGQGASSSKTVPVRTDAPGSSTSRKRLVPEATPSSPLEARLLQAFQTALEIEAAHLEPQLGHGGRFRPDFAIWLRSGPPDMPNPVVVEVTGPSGVRDKVRRSIDHLRRYARASSVKAAILVEEGGPESMKLVQVSPMIFRVGLGEAERLLREGRLVAEMARARNTLAHSVG